MSLIEVFDVAGSTTIQAADSATTVEIFERGLSISLPKVIGEAPSGAINGSNATFTTLQSFVPGSVQVYLNGLRLGLVDDFQTVGVQTILLNVSPTSGEQILVDYTRSN